MGFVDRPGPGCLRSGCSIFFLLVLYGILVVYLVNVPLAPYLKRPGGKVPTFIMAEDELVVRSGESFEIPCHLGASDPRSTGLFHSMPGSYRLDFSSSSGGTWTSHGSGWTKDGSATYRGVLDPGPVPGTRIIRIEFTGTNVWEASTKFVFVSVLR